MKLSLATLLFFLSLANVRGECLNVETRIIYQRKTETAQEVLCEKKIPLKKNTQLVFYVSKSCENDQCEILKRPKKNLLIKNYRGNIGSPGFKLCTVLGGVPQIFDYKKDKTAKWQTTERCYFEKDFVEISLLTHLWKSFINDY